jgi:hypothetical protein
MFKQKVTLSLFVSIHFAQHDSYTKLKIWYLSHAIFVKIASVMASSIPTKGYNAMTVIGKSLEHKQNFKNLDL